MSVGIAASGVADAVKCSGVSCAGEYPEGFAGGVILARIDMDEQLRLGLFEGKKKRGKRGDEQRRYKATIIGPLVRLPIVRIVFS